MQVCKISLLQSILVVLSRLSRAQEVAKTRLYNRTKSNFRLSEDFFRLANQKLVKFEQSIEFVLRMDGIAIEKQRRILEFSIVFEWFGNRTQ